MKTIAFIGAGNMGSALVRAVCRECDPAEVVVFDHNEEKMRALEDETGCMIAHSGAEAVTGARYVLLCVKPQHCADTLRELLSALKDDQTLVSIVTGAKLITLSSILSDGGLHLPVVRIMPNTPALLGKGLLLFAPAENVPAENLNTLQSFLSPCGLTERVEENMLDLATAVSGCGPAFADLFIEGLADGAVQIGMPRDQALRYAAQTVMGAAAMVLETGRHPGELKDAVCSPGGCAIVGVEKLEEGAFRHDAAQAVVASYRRNCELG